MSKLYIKVEQKEIDEIQKIMYECSIVPLEIIKRLLRKRGKDKEHIEIILNQVVKNKKAFYDDDKMYLRINKAINPKDVNRGVNNALLLIVDVFENIEDYFFKSKAPHMATFMKKDDKSSNPFYDIFYVPFSSEKLCAYQINEFAEKNGKTNAFIIVDDESQVSKLELSDKINVISFVTVNAGKISYLEV